MTPTIDLTPIRHRLAPRNQSTRPTVAEEVEAIHRRMDWECAVVWGLWITVLVTGAALGLTWLLQALL